MSSPSSKVRWFVQAALNTFAATYYYNYLFFLLRDQFGFGSKGNLLVSAMHGFIYIGAAWLGGRFAQRRGYATALGVGVAGMAACEILASLLPTAAGQIVALAGWTLGICCTWPALEALVCENEPTAAVARWVGIYNVVWAGTAAVAYAVGGALFETLGPRSLYWLPVSVQALQLVLLVAFARNGRRDVETHAAAAAAEEASAVARPADDARRAAHFLKLAWWANPFAYIAINTVLAVIPTLARKLNLSTAETGAFCSIWFFVRLATFAGLWQWTAWHYRFRWLAGAFVGMAVSFVVLLLAHPLWVLVLAQVVFGLACGLIYYSSLFYAMDATAAKGEHGGIHEALIGVGIFLGPAVGGATLYFLPQQPNSGAWAVSGLLAFGLAGLLRSWRRSRDRRSRNPSSARAVFE